MGKFKVGDLVECVETGYSYGSVLKGCVYCISHVNPSGTVQLRGGEPGAMWKEDRFKLLESPIPIEGIPDGWEVARIGTPKKGEYFLGLGGEPLIAETDMTRTRIIVRPVKPKMRPVVASDVGKTVRYGNVTDVLHAYGKVRCLLGEDGCDVVDTESLKVEE